VLTIPTARLPADGAVALIDTIEYYPETATEFVKWLVLLMY
jgi:hypothetical protein